VRLQVDLRHDVSSSAEAANNGKRGYSKSSVLSGFEGFSKG